MSMLDPTCPYRHSFGMSRYARHSYAGTRSRAEEKRSYKRLSRHTARTSLHRGLTDSSLLPEGITLPDYPRSTFMAEMLDWEYDSAWDVKEYMPECSRRYRKARLAEAERTIDFACDLAKAQASAWSAFTKSPVRRAYRYY